MDTNRSYFQGTTKFSLTWWMLNLIVCGSISKPIGNERSSPSMLYGVWVPLVFPTWDSQLLQTCSFKMVPPWVQLSWTEYLFGFNGLWSHEQFWGRIVLWNISPFPLYSCNDRWSIYIHLKIPIIWDEKNEIIK